MAGAVFGIKIYVDYHVESGDIREIRVFGRSINDPIYVLYDRDNGIVPSKDDLANSFLLFFKDVKPEGWPAFVQKFFDGQSD